MILLASSRLLQGVPAAAYGVLLVATGCLGFGFGTVVMALNTYAEEFAPGREDRAVLSLNALLGAGTALAPLLVAIFTGLGAWWLLPLTVAAAVAGLLLFSAGQPLVASSGGATGAVMEKRESWAELGSQPHSFLRVSSRTIDRTWTKNPSVNRFQP